MKSRAQSIFELYRRQRGDSMFVYCSEKAVDVVLRGIKRILKTRKIPYCEELIKKRELNFQEIVKAVNKCNKSSKVDPNVLAKNIRFTDIEAELLLEEIFSKIGDERERLLHLTVVRNTVGTPVSLFWARWFFALMIRSRYPWLFITSSNFLLDFMSVESADRRKRKISDGVEAYPLYTVSRPAFSKEDSGYIFDISKHPMTAVGDFYPLVKKSESQKDQSYEYITSAEFYMDSDLRRLFCFSSNTYSLQEEPLGILPRNLTKLNKTKARGREQYFHLLSELKSVMKDAKKIYDPGQVKKSKAKLDRLQAVRDSKMAHVRLIKSDEKRIKNDPQIFYINDSVVKMTIEEIGKEFILLPRRILW